MKEQQILKFRDEKTPVTFVMARAVQPGKEADYEAWMSKVIEASSQVSGHLGVDVIRPEDCEQPEYVTIFKFDQYSTLKKWLRSEAHQRLLAESYAFAPEEPRVQVLTGLESWFSLPGKTAPPPRYKMALLTTAVILPLGILLPEAAQRLLAGLPGVVHSLVITPIMVILMTYLLMPQATRLCSRWLYPPKQG